MSLYLYDCVGSRAIETTIIYINIKPGRSTDRVDCLPERKKETPVMPVSVIPRYVDVVFTWQG